MAEKAANKVTQLITKTTRLAKDARRPKKRGEEEEEEDDASDDWGEMENSRSMKLGDTTMVLPYNDLPQYAPAAPDQWNRKRR